MDTIDRIAAAIDGRCACGCGARISPHSPSAWYATEGCQARWIAQQRGDQPPTPPPYPAPSAPAPADDNSPLRILFRRGYRLALPGTTAPWLRRCGNCGVVDTPGDGRRALPVTFDPVPYPASMERREYEDCNLCEHCGTPTPGPYLTALWARVTAADAYHLALLHGDRYTVHLATGQIVRDRTHDRAALVNAWRHVERHVLRDLAPRCQHPSICTEPAADRYHITHPIQWLHTWLAPGRALLLCALHSNQLMHHVTTLADPLAPRCPYQRERLDWTQL